MIKKILLDNKEFHFTNSHLPILIHGEEHMGASLFTITVLADMRSMGTKVVALTQYPMAVEEFENQIGQSDNAQFYTNDNADAFVNFITTTPDINDYTVLLKNIEFLSEEVFDAIKNFKNLIISGDINKCSFKDAILQNIFTTKIFFSPLDAELPHLNAWEGFLVSENLQGVVSVEAD